MKNFFRKLFRNNNAKDKSIPDKNDSEIVLYVFDKFNEYTENPPQELVQSIIYTYRDEGKEISYEDAKALVPYEAIKRYISNEVNIKFKGEYTETLGINVGLRAGDLLSLRIGDVTDGKTIFDTVSITEQKTGKSRKFALNKNAKGAIQLYIDTLANYDLEDYLFKSRKGGHLGVRPLHRIIKTVTRDLGIKGNYGTHTLRKTMAYHRYINNVPLETLQKLLNHSSSTITLKDI